MGADQHAKVPLARLAALIASSPSNDGTFVGIGTLVWRGLHVPVPGSVMMAVEEAAIDSQSGCGPSIEGVTNLVPSQPPLWSGRDKPGCESARDGDIDLLAPLHPADQPRGVLSQLREVLRRPWRQSSRCATSSLQR